MLAYELLFTQENDKLTVGAVLAVGWLEDVGGGLEDVEGGEEDVVGGTELELDDEDPPSHG